MLCTEIKKTPVERAVTCKKMGRGRGELCARELTPWTKEAQLASKLRSTLQVNKKTIYGKEKCHK